MKYFAMLIKPASAACNLACKYCFYHDVAQHRKVANYGMMRKEVMEAIIKRSLAAFEAEVTLTYAFQGGEPTLAGLAFFEEFVRCVEKYRKDYEHVRYCLQTNGILLDHKWCQFLKANNFLVGLSLDGPEGIHDAQRVFKDGSGSYEIVKEKSALLKAEKIPFNILTVLTKKTARAPEEYFNFIKAAGFDYLQLIPCLPSFDLNNDPYALSPRQFYAFYSQFFDLWYQELLNKHYISVTLFDNILLLFSGRLPDQCGFLGNCACQYVIEANGNVYPCDFYVLDQYCLGSILTDDIDTLQRRFLSSKFRKEKKKLSRKCRNCAYWSLCGGQCKRLSICYYNKDYCAYAAFLKEKEAQFKEILTAGLI